MVIIRQWRKLIRSLNKKKRFLGLVVHFGATIVAGFAGFALANAVLFDLTTVEGQSMEPTLFEDDRLLVSNIEQLAHRIIGSEYVPARGDIIVFQNDFSDDGLLIKRVVGLPGERVVIRHQTLTIYNKAFPEGFEPDLDDRETTLEFGKGEHTDTFVDLGEIFVVGDNPSASADSRLFGNISLEDIEGRLMVRTWPLSEFKLFKKQ